ncbi:MAG TPA: SGNH/GDSL hydrolase family protein [Vicinamibacterales bacterium]|nr:SGNH/GDSL hydrolase family protein [Vicinamibacterales bacterium]
MNRPLLIAALLALFGSGIACNKSENPTSPTPPVVADGPIFYTAIGASDGIGFGSSSPCVPFTDCPDGKGYVQILRRRLRDAFPTRTVEHRNLSIPGAVLSKAIEDLARDIGQPISELAGNFVERQAPFVPANTTHVTIFAGGNDANVIGRAVVAGRGGSDPNAYIDAQVRQWGTDLEDLVARIRSRAPNARIVALNMINLAAAPYVGSRPQSEKSVMQRIAVGISDRVNALTARQVLVVDLMCDARLYQASNYSSDGFHPGDGGYAIFAEDALPALKDGTNNQPNTGCAQRRLFP